VAFATRAAVGVASAFAPALAPAFWALFRLALAFAAVVPPLVFVDFADVLVFEEGVLLIWSG
jgi:cytochrome c oxidase subunit IV